MNNNILLESKDPKETQRLLNNVLTALRSNAEVRIIPQDIPHEEITKLKYVLDDANCAGPSCRGAIVIGIVDDLNKFSETKHHQALIERFKFIFNAN